MNKIIALTVAASVLGVQSALAEVSFVNVFAKYHDLDSDSFTEDDVTVLGGSIEFVTGGWTFSGEASDFSIDGDSLTLFSLGAAYTLPNSVTLGLDYDDFDVDGIGSTSIVSAYAYYTWNDLSVGLSFGDAEDVDDTVYSLFAAYDISESGRVGIDIVELDGETLVAAYADYDTDNFALSATAITLDGLDIFAVSGEYKINKQFSVIGSLGQGDFLGDDLTSVSIGGKYSFAPGVSAELGLAHLSDDVNDDVNVITFGVQYELGRKTSPRRTISNIINQATGDIAGLSNF